MPRVRRQGPTRVDQSKYPAYRVPSQQYWRKRWDERKLQILRLMEKGLTSKQIGEELRLTPEKVRHSYQRMYNELGLIRGKRNTIAILRMAYAMGWLECPCQTTCNGQKETGPESR